MVHSYYLGSIDFNAQLLGDEKGDVSWSIHMVSNYWKGGPPVDTGFPDGGSRWLPGNKKYWNSHQEQTFLGVIV